MQLAIEALDGVGGADQPPHLLRILEIGADVGPVVPPGLGDFGVFLVPVLLKGIQNGLIIHSGIDCLQVGHERLQLLVGHLFAGIVQLVDDAVLDLGFGKDGMNDRIKLGQVICAGNENILHAPVPQAIEYGRPKLGALIFAYPHTQYILASVQVDTNGNVYRFLHNLSPAADMIVDGIQKYRSVNGFQRPLLPLFGNG